jgi:hypothetical protein
VTWSFFILHYKDTETQRLESQQTVFLCLRAPVVKKSLKLHGFKKISLQHIKRRFSQELMIIFRSVDVPEDPFIHERNFNPVEPAEFFPEIR